VFEAKTVKADALSTVYSHPSLTTFDNKIQNIHGRKLGNYISS